MTWLWLPFVLRPLITVLTQTFFQPDEYFQALEPAHHAVFGYGRLTWEWKTDPPIRSIAYPAVWMPVYYALKVTGLDDGALLIAVPKFLAGIVAALTDVYVAKLASKVLGKEYADVTLLVSLSSVFHTLALSRTLSNSMETSLTTIALYYWPLAETSSSNIWTALSIAGFSFLIRPTSAVLWTFLGLDLLRRTCKDRASMCHTLAPVMTLGALYSLILFGLDTFYYGQLTFTPLNFIRVNLSSVSSFYGSNPFHYYITQALPILCGTALPFVVHGAWSGYRASGHTGQTARTLLQLCAWTIGIYSLSGHKEWRFIHPILPILHIFAAKSLVDLYRRTPEAKRRSHRLPVRRSHLALILCGLPASVYVMFFHGRAQITAIHYLRSLPSSQLRSVGFLMPCHSTPWQAYLHRPEVEIWAIGCEPPLQGQDITTYKDQTRVFYDDPVAYLRDRFPQEVDLTFPPSPVPWSPPGDSTASAWVHTWPSHLVTFGALEDQYPGAREIFLEKGYIHFPHRFFNGWEEDEKRKGGVQVWTLGDSILQRPVTLRSGVGA